MNIDLTIMLALLKTRSSFVLVEVSYSLHVTHK